MNRHDRGIDSYRAIDLKRPMGVSSILGRHNVILAAVLATLSLHGCSLYEPTVIRAYVGNEFPRSKVTVVRGWDTVFGYPGGMHVVIEKVDGVTTGPPAYKPEIELLPGRHVLEVSSFTSSSHSTTNRLVEFDAAAGKMYEIRADHQSEGGFSMQGTWTAWVIEVDPNDW